MLDYIVVGLGLAGVAFCEILEENNKKFVVFNDQSQTSSRIAGGLSNPVILKRFTLAWKADELIPESNMFYSKLEHKLQKKFLQDLEIYRRFFSVEEQNSWFEASDKKQLKPFLDPQLVRNYNYQLAAPYNFGSVLQAKKLDTENLLSAYTNYLIKKDLLQAQKFDYNKLIFHNSYLSYRGVQAKKIVFAEGFGLKKNPFFNYLPLQGSKGEYITIRAPLLKAQHAIKSSMFIIPLGNDKYKVGATYNNNDFTNTPTIPAKEQILKKLDEVLLCPYEEVAHVAGVRPTVKDRRPLIGKHPNHEQLLILNGFGSHGVMIAPWAANQLYNHIENNSPISIDADIARFESMKTI